MRADNFKKLKPDVYAYLFKENEDGQDRGVHQTNVVSKESESVNMSLFTSHSQEGWVNIKMKVKLCQVITKSSAVSYKVLIKIL